MTRSICKNGLYALRPRGARVAPVLRKCSRLSKNEPKEKTAIDTSDIGIRLQAAAQRATQLGVPAMTSELVGIVGAAAVAVIGRTNETRVVRAWAEGRDAPARAGTLAFALALALVIAEFQGREIVQAWFLGANSWLGYESPLVILRDRPLDDSTRKTLMSAARAFALSV